MTDRNSPKEAARRHRGETPPEARTWVPGMPTAGDVVLWSIFIAAPAIAVGWGVWWLSDSLGWGIGVGSVTLATLWLRDFMGL